MSSRRRQTVFANVTISVALLVWLLGKVDWSSMRRCFDSIELAHLSLAACSFVSIAALELIRLGVILRPFGLSWIELARLHVVGVFFGNFLPGQIGADLFKVVTLRPFDGGVARILSLVFVLRIVGFSVVLLFVLGASPIYGPALLASGPELRLALDRPVHIVFGSACLIALLVATRSRVLGPLGERLGKSLTRARATARAVLGRNLAHLIALSVFVLMARALVLFFLVRAVGAELALIGATFIVSLATLITLAPISFAGWGLREGALTLLLVHSGLTNEQAVLVALGGRALMVLLSGAGAIWLALGISFGWSETST